jgi:hypothetical protein
MVAQLSLPQSLVSAQPLVSALERKAEPDLARAAIQKPELESVQAPSRRESCRRTTIYSSS